MTERKLTPAEERIFHEGFASAVTGFGHGFVRGLLGGVLIGVLVAWRLL